MTRSKTIVFGVIFFIIGAGILIGGGFTVKNIISFLDNSIKTEGNVINIIQSRSSDGGNLMYSPEVSFVDAKGQTITFGSNTSSSVSTYKIGEKVSVLYRKDNSQDAKINTFFQIWFGSIMVVFLGGIFFLIGLITIVRQIRKNSLAKRLLSSGTRISAKVISVETSNLRSGFSVGSRLPEQSYQVIAQWLNPANNQMYIFKSDSLNYNPESFVVGKDVEVYIDLANPKNYYINLANIPKVAN
jgi:hypothetical protein